MVAVGQVDLHHHNLESLIQSSRCHPEDNLEKEHSRKLTMDRLEEVFLHFAHQLLDLEC